jgi:hypothetical protein
MWVGEGGPLGCPLSAFDLDAEDWEPKHAPPPAKQAPMELAVRVDRDGCTLEASRITSEDDWRQQVFTYERTDAPVRRFREVIDEPAPAKPFEAEVWVRSDGSCVFYTPHSSDGWRRIRVREVVE